MGKSDKYIPALRYDWLTPLYDPLLRWIMREEKFKRRLIAQADIQPGHRVLDLGWGAARRAALPPGRATRSGYTVSRPRDGASLR